MAKAQAKVPKWAKASSGKKPVKVDMPKGTTGMRG